MSLCLSSCPGCLYSGHPHLEDCDESFHNKYREPDHISATKQKLWWLCKKFVVDQEITCAESVHQSDRVIENAYQLIEEICDLVGYYDYKTGEIKPNA